MKAFNIQWDTDGDMELFNNLPKEIQIPDEMTDEDDIFDYADNISDYISNETGFCHFGFDLITE